MVTFSNLQEILHEQNSFTFPFSLCSQKVDFYNCGWTCLFKSCKLKVKPPCFIEMKQTMLLLQHSFSKLTTTRHWYSGFECWTCVLLKGRINFLMFCIWLPCAEMAISKQNTSSMTLNSNIIFTLLIGPLERTVIHQYILFLYLQLGLLLLCDFFFFLIKPDKP